MKKANNLRLASTVVGAFVLFLTITIFNNCDLIDDDPPKDEHEVGDTLWIHDIIGGDSLFIDQSMAIGKDGSIYYAKSGGTAYWTPSRIVALNKDNGSLKWESPTLDNIAISSQIVVGDDGTIYVIGFYNLYAIDAGTGQFKWTWTVPQTLPDGEGGNVYTYGQIGALALTNSGDLVLGSVGSGAYFRALYSISKTGATKWHNLKANGTGIISNIAVGKNEQLFYYSKIEGEDKLVAVDANTGSIQWTTKVANATSGGNNIVIQDDGKLVCSFVANAGEPSRLHRIDPANGNILWSSVGESSYWPMLIGTDGSIYQNVSAINKFSASTGDRQIFNSSILADEIGAINSEGQLIIANTASGVRYLSTFDSDGSMDWTVPIDGVLGGPIVVSNEKVIYSVINLHPISRLPKQIYAIQGNAKLATTGWPRPAHDNRNTSNVNK